MVALGMVVLGLVVLGLVQVPTADLLLSATSCIVGNTESMNTVDTAVYTYTSNARSVPVTGEAILNIT
jgi:hypothetical protein